MERFLVHVQFQEENNMIIYKAVNIINNKIYIGQTVSTLGRRISVHRYQMNQGSKISFTKALRKYGIDNFIWKMVDTALTMKELNEKECYWIKFLSSNDPSIGYNINSGGRNGKLNKIGIERIRKRKKGSKVSEIGRQRMSESAKKRGDCITPEGKKRISDANKKNRNAAKLSKKDVCDIFELQDKGLPQQFIANKFKVTQPNISIILKGRI